MDESQGGLSYGIGAVARRLGVPAPTLRTWNLRYGIGPSSRSPGGHRRYGALDLTRLEEMNRLIKSGAPPAEAAQAALRIRSVPDKAQEDRSAPVREVDRRDVGKPVSEGARPERSVEQEAGRLARAAMALDSWSVEEAVASGLGRFGVTETWDRLVLPSFAVISRRQAATGVGVDVEHMFSERLMAAFTALIGRPARPINPRPVMLACAEDEQHCLPVFALAAALASEHSVEVRVLGARTPFSALGDAMRRLNPALVFVWSQMAETGNPEPLTRLPVLRPPSPIMTGGPGWRELPPDIGHLTSMNEAIIRIVGLLR
ncbi:MerR family transcriptional regulator [Acrocarpospora pleiomorpha]|uniref:MerR family transcriptional regulator n=1 Tax=Acrocarpospora pleiomorpha TaxID=90975 RepID=A0A5M3Y311_9ACTN|nr:MerR family transcriptional regulator [Acrocarpospora pleiomorpha]GES26669.1 MerR family transcriptional regulator [Acrocarpospora pleiomorpha]